MTLYLTQAASDKNSLLHWCDGGVCWHLRSIYDLRWSANLLCMTSGPEVSNLQTCVVRMSLSHLVAYLSTHLLASPCQLSSCRARFLRVDRQSVQIARRCQTDFHFVSHWFLPSVHFKVQITCKLHVTVKLFPQNHHLVNCFV